MAIHIQLLDYTPNEILTGFQETAQRVDFIKDPVRNNTKLIVREQLDNAVRDMETQQGKRYHQINIMVVLENERDYLNCLRIVQLARRMLDGRMDLKSVPQAFFSLVENELYNPRRRVISVLLSLSHPRQLPEFAESFHEMSAEDYFTPPGADYEIKPPKNVSFDLHGKPTAPRRLYPRRED